MCKVQNRLPARTSGANGQCEAIPGPVLQRVGSGTAPVSTALSEAVAEVKEQAAAQDWVQVAEVLERVFGGTGSEAANGQDNAGEA